MIELVVPSCNGDVRLAARARATAWGQPHNSLELEKCGLPKQECRHSGTSPEGPTVVAA